MPGEYQYQQHDGRQRARTHNARDLREHGVGGEKPVQHELKWDCVAFGLADSAALENKAERKQGRRQENTGESEVDVPLADKRWRCPTADEVFPRRLFDLEIKRELFTRKRSRYREKVREAPLSAQSASVDQGLREQHVVAHNSHIMTKLNLCDRRVVPRLKRDLILRIRSKGGRTNYARRSCDNKNQEKYDKSSGRRGLAGVAWAHRVEQ